MCPKIKFGVCEIVGIEPWLIECAETGICHGNLYERCKLYLAEYFAGYKGITIPHKNRRKYMEEKNYYDVSKE